MLRFLKRREEKSTYKRGIGEDDRRLVGQDVELDDVTVAVPVDDFRICVKKQGNVVICTKCVKRNKRQTSQQVKVGTAVETVATEHNVKTRKLLLTARYQ